MSTTTVIGVVSQKGGAAKTTTAMNLAGVLHLAKKKVLCVDLDQQATLSKRFGFQKLPHDLFTRELEPLTTRTPGIDLLPGSPTLHRRALECDLHEDYGRLKERLERYREGYDYVLLDTHPGINGLAKAAMAACDLILVPSRVNDDIVELIEVEVEAEELRARGLPVPNRLAAVGTQFDTSQRGLLAYARRQYPYWRETLIRRSLLYDRSALNGKWLPAALLGNRGSAPRKDHTALMHELELA